MTQHELVTAVVSDLAGASAGWVEDLNVLLTVAPEGGSADLKWQEEALCAQVDPELFFPEKGGSTKEAKSICMACSVRTPCLEFALTNGERYGIYGGLSERQRRPLLRDRGLAA